MKPASALVAALSACAGLGALVVAGYATVDAWSLACGLLALAVLTDASQLARQAGPDVVRELPAVVPVGIERGVTLRLRHAGALPLVVDVHDLHPGEWPVAGLPRRVRLAARRELAFEYRLTPIERGTFRFAGTEVWVRSPMGFFRRKLVVDNAQGVRVFPNFAPLARLALVGAEQASRVVGAHLKRRRGEGTEFQQLREYRTGDSLRQIDWKASRRALKLISRDYQDERNQQIVLVVDTGRRMLAKDGALAHFDHALNAVLMVAYIALKRGDAVGLLATGGTRRFMPPKRGLGAINGLLDAVYDLKPQAVATDYLEAAAEIGARQPRRSLVLFVTNVRDEDLDDLAIAVRQFQRRHLVAVASLRELALDAGLAKPVRSFDDAVEAGALARYLEDRTRAHDALRAQGVPVLDVTAAELPAALVEHYLAVKRAASL